jgi:dTDP-4-amino-4,6-dideoxygalactose transaminase
MIKQQIPLAKPSFDHLEVEAVKDVLERGWVVQGPEVEGFENLIIELHKVKNCIAVSSGTAALHICYLSLGIGHGDAVFIPSFAWPSAANMAMLVGARPVFVDVLPETFNIDPCDLRKKIEQCIKNRLGNPRAVVPVHEFGLAADMDSITTVAYEFGLEIIEDAACALGAKFNGVPVGTIGEMGTFSFHPRKAITTGEGGAIITNDDELARKCRIWRNHGQEVFAGKRDFQFPGLNYRMNEIQAAIGKVQFGKFSEILKKRKNIAESYIKNLTACPSIKLPVNSAENTWQTFMIVLDNNCDRDQIIDTMAKAGFGCSPGSVSAHCAKFYRERFGYMPADLPISAKLDVDGLALPLHSFVTDADVVGCSSVLREILMKR